jgi:biliverdin reductase / flavin reductase
MQKSILVFGATGNTGLEVIKQALAQGHAVTAIVRNDAPLKGFIGLQIIKGDIYDLGFITKTLTEIRPDVVISCLGVHGTNAFNRTKLYSETMTVFVAAMQAAGVTKRIVCISSWGSKKATENNWVLQWILKPMLFAGFIHNMALMKTILEKSHLDYTIVRPPGLTNKPATGKVILEQNLYQNTKGKWTITRADLAAILLDVATNNICIKQGIAVANFQ